MNLRIAIPLVGMTLLSACSHATPENTGNYQIHHETKEWLESLEENASPQDLSESLEDLTARARTIAMESVEHSFDSCPPEELTARLSAVGSLVRAMTTEQSRRDDSAYQQVLRSRLNELREYTTGCVSAFTNGG